MATLENVYEIRVVKHLVGSDTNQHWTNEYMVTAPSLPSANDFALGAVLDAETAIHTTHIEIVEIHTHLPHNAGVFISTPMRALGTYDPTGEMLPLFLALRADFTADFGRPGRKFYHTAVGETAQDAGVWTTPYIDDIEGFLDTLIIASAAGDVKLTVGGDREILAASVQSGVTEHQFRRKWARRNPTPTV